MVEFWVEPHFLNPGHKLHHCLLSEKGRPCSGRAVAGLLDSVPLLALTIYQGGIPPSLLQGKESSAIRLSIVWERLHRTWTNYPVTVQKNKVWRISRPHHFHSSHWPGLPRNQPDLRAWRQMLREQTCGWRRNVWPARSPSEEDAVSTSSTMALFRAGGRPAWWETPQSWKCPDETENKERSSVDTAADSCVMYW